MASAAATSASSRGAWGHSLCQVGRPPAGGDSLGSAEPAWAAVEVVLLRFLDLSRDESRESLYVVPGLTGGHPLLKRRIVKRAEAAPLGSVPGTPRWLSVQDPAPAAPATAGGGRPSSQSSPQKLGRTSRGSTDPVR